MSDVASLAGVSHQTVSRVLNDHPNVRPETRGRVLDAIAALGYRRNSAARALVTRRTATFGVVTQGLALFGPTSTLMALEQAAREAGYYLLVATIPSFEPRGTGAAIDRLLDHGVEGVVVIAPQAEATSAVEHLRAPVPMVMISAFHSPNPNAHSVGIDQYAGGLIATRHLLDLGRRDLVHVTGPYGWHEADDRLRGFDDACAEAGVTGRAIRGDWTAELGYLAGRRMVDEGVPTGVFAANDQLALGVLRAFWEAGVRVPDDVAVVGFDDIDGSAYFVPPLTTVRQDFAGVARATVGALTAAIAGEPVVPDVAPPVLVVRDSTVRPT